MIDQGGGGHSGLHGPLGLRQIVWFFGKLIVIYALLIAPWPGWEETYGRAFRAGGNVLFGAFGSEGRVRFDPAPPPVGMWDTHIVLTHRTQPGTVAIGETSRYTGYLPVALVLALVLSTPVGWRRRVTALLWGLLAVHVFIVFRLWVQIYFEFRIREGSSIGLYEISRFWEVVLANFVEFIAVSPVITSAIPVPIWLLVTFRRRDLAVLRQQTAGNRQ